MRFRTVAVLAALAAAAATPLALPAEDPEEAAIRAVLEHYLAGHATGDGAHFQQAFHPESRLFWVQDDELRTRTSAEYIAGASGRPAADEAQRRRRIVSIDYEGTAAIGKIELDYPTSRFIDYMSLLKINGEWRIVNKSFHRAPKGG